MKLRLVAALLLAWPLVPRPALPQSAAALPDGIIERIEFHGLRRVSPAALRAQIGSREGERVVAARVEKDVRALNRLGWFDSISVEVQPVSADIEPSGLRLVFHLAERAFLAQFEFRGSRVLAQERIAALLAAKGIKLKTAAPANRAELWRAARAIETQLADLGHPRAAVRVRLEEMPGRALRARFQIDDGPRIRVGRVTFAGNRGVSERELRRQMKRVAPTALFAGLRGKTIYTPERLAEDLDRLQRFYRNHGYAEARVGQPQVELGKGAGFAITIPVEEGPFYRLAAVEIEGATPQTRAALAPALDRLAPGAPYAQERLEHVREELARLAAQEVPPERPGVELLPQFDRAAGTARVTLRVRKADDYIVRRIEFLGDHRFSDRYYRRRIALQEGESFDPRKLERGLERLARSGFVKPATPRDVRVRLDESARAADITIRFEEIGRQRVSLVGGVSGQANTLGVVYNLFNLFGGEELLTTHLEGGPESVNLLLGVAKEGLFGTRVSMGLSVYRNIIRPRVQAAAGRQRLFTSSSSGFGLAWDYPLTPRDTLGAKYDISKTATRINPAALPQPTAGLPAVEPRARDSARTMKLEWAHNSGLARLDAASWVSGGVLGGDEKLLGLSLDSSRVAPDPFTDARNSWALRGRVEGVSAYGGRSLPLQDRLFGGEQLLRGFRTAELGPYALVESQGRPALQALPAGADLAAAFNGEYRVPLDQRFQAAGFFDVGTGWLLPNWLGPSKPNLLGGTNGILRASTGIETRFLLPVVNQPLRFDYAANPLRLARALVLPDGSAWRPSDRHTAFTWALGTLF